MLSVMDSSQQLCFFQVKLLIKVINTDINEEAEQLIIFSTLGMGTIQQRIPASFS